MNEQTSPADLLAQVLALVRARSLRRAQIDWDSLVPEFEAKAGGCRTIAEAHELIRALLTHLGDGHSFLRTKREMARNEDAHHSGLRLHQAEPIVIDVFPDSPAASQGIRIGDRISHVAGQAVMPGNWKRLRREALQAGVRLSLHRESRELVMSAGFARPHALPRGRLVAPDLGFIDLPGHDGNGTADGARCYAGFVARQLHELEKAGARGWVVDLRRCDGGNMWPLLAGLVPLLGIGRYGSFVDSVGGVWYDWGFDGQRLQVVNRQEPDERYSMAEVPDWKALKQPGAPVSLLTSEVTSSSGEAVLISFLGRERTRTFGLPTGGLPTSNNLHVLLDGSWLLLTESLEADREGIIYRGPIEPDQSVEFDWTLLGTGDDPAVQAAREWLRHQLGENNC